MKTVKTISVILLIVFLAGCLPVAEISVGGTQLPETTPLPTRGATPPVLPTIQPDLYSVDAMRGRSYGTGEFTVDKLWYTYTLFDRYYVIYDSDGLNIHGYVNIPNGGGPHPVIVMIHGWIPRDEYETLDYTLRYADHLAKNGYIVLHPNLRSFPPSDSPPEGRDYHAGYTSDVLNLVAYVRDLAGKDGIFRTADVSRIGIWGHSIGGSIAMRAMSVEPDTFDAALLYAPVSQRYGGIVPGSIFYDFSAVSARLSIHHGELDEIIDVENSRLLCSQLEDIGKQPECFFYEDQPHTFYRNQYADPLLMQRTLELFDQSLK